MKKLLVLFLIFLSLKSFSQQVDGRVYSNISSPIKWQHGWFDKTLYIPGDTLNSTRPALAIKGGKLLYTNGSSPWSEVTGGNAVVDSAIYSTIARVRKITDSLNALTNTALAGKQPLGSYAAASHTHNVGDITGITTSVVPEGANQYFTNARARTAISLSVTGISGAATYNNTTGALNIPTYTLTGLGGVPVTRSITINGTTLDLSQDRTWTISAGGSGNWGSIGGTLSSQTDLQSALDAKANTSTLSSYVPTTRTINGLDLSANRTFTTTDIGEGTNQYFTNARARSALSLTTTGSSGSATYNSGTGVFNIPTITLGGIGAEPAIGGGTTGQYWRGDKTWQTLPVYTLSGLGGVPTARTITINGTPFDLSADRSWTVSGLPSGGTNGQVVMLSGSTPTWSDIGYPPTAVSDVTGLQDSLNSVRNASALATFAVPYTASITSGSSSTVAAGIYRIDIDPATLIASYTLTMPAAPADGQRLLIRTGRQIAAGSVVVTSFTISANSGQSLYQAITPTSLSGGDVLEYEYELSTTTWTRIR
jgi:hypothetical protein